MVSTLQDSFGALDAAFQRANSSVEAALKAGDIEAINLAQEALKTGREAFERELEKETVILDDGRKLLRREYEAIFKLAESSAEAVSTLLSLSEIVNLRGRRALWGYRKISDPEPIALLRSIEELDLRGCKLKDISPFRSLSKLQRLDLGHNPIQDLAPISELSELKELEIENTKITDIAPLCQLKVLEILKLDGTEVQDISLLAQLNSLKSLSLRGMGITDIEFLKGLTALQALSLSDNELSDISALANLQNLQNLYLNSNKISDIGVLTTLPSLATLVIRSFPSWSTPAKILGQLEERGVRVLLHG